MKKTLVISNACFSESISNGRTLAGLFENAEPEKLAQFFVYGAPDWNICGNYYRVTDKDALRSLFPFGPRGGVIRQEKQACRNKRSGLSGARRKTPAKMLLREIVWLMGSWKGRRLWDWMDEFGPEAICLFLANNVFLIRFAISAAKRYRIPIIVYTTEGYCFMNYNYITNRPSLAYTLYYKWLRSIYKKLEPFVSQGIFNSTLLKERYEKEFGYPCSCIMNRSAISYIDHALLRPEEAVTISYLGNLGLKRHKVLIEVAEILQELNSDFILDVYGASPEAAVDQELRGCPYIRYHGFVPYSEVVKIIHSSTLLVHAEWNDADSNRDLKYAFSTKIADSLASGTPLFLYADESLAETMFLQENQCAFIANKRKDLRAVLEQALTDQKARKKIVENAKKVTDTYLLGSNAFLEAFL